MLAVHKEWALSPENRPWILTAILGVLTLVLALLHPYARNVSAPSEPFTFTASDKDGTLSLQWDATHRTVRRADSGLIEIQDGSKIIRATLESREVYGGVFQHRRESTDVLLTLTLLRNHQPLSTAVVRSIGP